MSYLRSIVFVIVFSSLIVACTSKGGGLEGTWIIDAKATENYVKSTPPLDVSKLAKWFELSAKNWAKISYEFDGDTVIESTYGVDGKSKFHLTSQSDTEKHYFLEAVTHAPTKSLTISLLKDGNLKIVPSWEPEMGYVLWKQGSLRQEQSTPNGLMTEWVASIRNIILFLFEPLEKSPESSNPIEKENPRSNLEAAIQNGTIRRATIVDAHAWLDADMEKYMRKNLPPADDLDEAFILGSWIYKANAYVVLKKFTYPPGMIDNYVAIFLIPRDVPMPDGEYGHSKIYHFYEDYYEGPSVEYSAGSSWAKSQWSFQ